MNAAIEKTATDKIEITGVLNFANVTQLRKKGNKLIKEHADPVFDLRRVVAGDSAGVALLIAWARFAKQHGRTIRFINLPEQLLDMARLSALDHILPIG